MASKILVVEDDKEIRETLVQYLKGKGYNVVSAPDGEKGLTELVAQKPDLLLMDINMPNMSGLSALDLIKDARRTTFEMFGIADPLRILIVSSQADEDTIKRAKSLGANEFMAKPFSYEKLAVLIASMLTAQVSNSGPQKKLQSK